MKISFETFLKAAVAILALGLAGGVAAAPYNILLKDAGGTPQSCATGGFAFTKTTAGAFPVTSPGVVLANGCFNLFGQLTFNQSPSVQAQVVTTTSDKPGTGGAIETLNNGPNVEGISGSLTNITNQYRIDFAFAGTAQPFTRTFQIVRLSDGAVVASGPYYVFNATRTVPEPNTAALVAAAAAALIVAGLRRRRAARVSRER
ncbi:MAG: hypothetical protein OHK0026_15970 [Rhodocyclaceae bacterium]